MSKYLFLMPTINSVSLSCELTLMGKGRVQQLSGPKYVGTLPWLRIPALTPAYRGPYLVHKRSSKVFIVKIRERFEAVTLDRLKPHLGGPPQAAAPPRRGRPPGRPSPGSSSSPQASIGGGWCRSIFDSVYSNKSTVCYVGNPGDFWYWNKSVSTCPSDLYTVQFWSQRHIVMWPPRLQHLYTSYRFKKSALEYGNILWKNNIWRSRGLVLYVSNKWKIFRCRIHKEY
jgi:hypothetical protein